MKRILSLLLAISVLTTCFVISAASAAEVDYNKDALLLLKTLVLLTLIFQAMMHSVQRLPAVSLQPRRQKVWA